MQVNLKILILEDSFTDAELIQRALKKGNIQCETKIVDTRSKFEEAVKNYRPDIILSDHTLPNFNSSEAFRIARESKYDIPFILVTGTVSEEFAVECMKSGVDDYILKSSLIRLPSSIEHILSQRKEKREKEEMELLNKNMQIEYTESLKKTNKELDQFAYVISHDLKAPLKAVVNLCEWIEEDIGATIPEEAKKNMTLMKGRVRRMEALINGVLEYSRAIKVKQKNENIDLKIFLRELIELISPPSNFRIAISDDMPVVKGEKFKLQQVFTNLISNAIKHNTNTSEGSVTIEYKMEGKDFYCFSVKDNGPGIEAEYHEKIFQIFQTLEARDKIENTGVGLAIVKKIVEEQQGVVMVESEKGKGSIFSFTWPR